MFLCGLETTPRHTEHLDSTAMTLEQIEIS